MKLKKQRFCLGRIPKCLTILAFFLCSSMLCFAQTSGSITVGGDINTFYPVAWFDGNWDTNKNTNLNIGRSAIHTNGLWHGAFIAAFSFHTTNGGHEAQMIDVRVTGSRNNAIHKDFIAGWQDATRLNNDKTILIWLRGGGTTYYYSADAPVNPKVYDAVQYALPYISSDGNDVFNVKSSLDNYVSSVAYSSQLPINIYGTASNFMEGNLGIGIRNPTEKLAVNGTIRAKEIKVEAASWPDYVFEESYDLLTLKETERFIKENKHLPNIPAAKEIAANGLSLGEMNRLLLQKIEELTLHLIEKDKQIVEQRKDFMRIEQEIKKLKEAK